MRAIVDARFGDREIARDMAIGAATYQTLPHAHTHAKLKKASGLKLKGRRVRRPKSLRGKVLSDTASLRSAGRLRSCVINQNRTLRL